MRRQISGNTNNDRGREGGGARERERERERKERDRREERERRDGRPIALIAATTTSTIESLSRTRRLFTT